MLAICKANYLPTLSPLTEQYWHHFSLTGGIGFIFGGH
ncbi:hypothetical protein CWATWH0005_5052 [Crocosphaera watsonii WH 0005]|uniref:Uncharacterized protein n=1 Tax=Crocosphaera watsonii WH 0005 TaxID=423472 RepID=T2IWP1_CROWT|nr:hypothetical protein CWATWH0005_5052 [Crocosphaera watsonii WH 0005]